MNPTLPNHEAARLEALRKYQILDTLPEQAFDDLTFLAAQVCDAPMALISFLDAEREWLKSKIGVEASEFPRYVAFCAHAVRQPDLFVVADTLRDERFATNSLVTSEPYIRFYAGAPLVTPEGYALGVLCVLDRVPRELDRRGEEALRALSRQVMTQLQIRNHAANANAARRNYEDLVNSIDGIVWEVEADSLRPFFISKQAERLLGYPLKQQLEEPSFWKNHLHPDDRERTVAECKEATEQMRDHELEYRMITHDGRTVWVRDLVTVIVENDQAVRLRGVKVDITARKRAEESLAKALSERENIMETLSDIIYMLDSNANVVKWNRRLEIVTGLSSAEIIGKPAIDFIREEDRDKIAAAIREGFEKGYAEVEGHLLRKDGAPVPYQWSGVPLRGEGEEVLGLTGMGRDITERRTAEELLRESEDRYRDLVENSQDLICTHDLEGRLLSVNPWAAKVIGYDPSSLLKKNIRDGLLPEFRHLFDEYLTRIQRDGCASGLMVVQTRTGEKRIWEYNNTLRTDGVAAPVVRGMAHDITERRAAEEALRASERFARSTLDALSAHIAILDEKGVVVAVNRAWREFAKANAATPDVVDIGDNYLAICEATQNGGVAPADDFAAGIRAVMNGEQQEFSQEYSCHSSSEQLWFIGRVTRFPGEGPTRVVVAHESITKRKRAEELLQKTVSLLTSTLESTADGLLVVGLDRKIITFNTKFTEMWRIPEHVIEPRDDEQMLAFVQDQLTDPVAFMTRVKQLYTQPAATGYDVVEFKDGRIYERYCQPQTLNGKPIGRVWSFRDATDRKRAEERLRESEMRFRDIFEKDLAANSISTPDARLLACNQSFLRMFGFSSTDEALGCDLNSLFRSKAERDEVVDVIRQHRTLVARELHMRRIDGTPINTVTNAVGIFDDAGELTEIHGHGFDITEQKEAERARAEAEAALRRSEQHFRALIENASDVITVLSADGVIRYESPAIRRFRGYAPEELIGRQVSDFVHPDDLPAIEEAFAFKLANPGVPISFECRMLHKDGTYRFVEGMSVNLLGDPAVNGIVANTRDVTDRKQAERALRESEEQLQQAQKMEAVGRLAGGIAHDFNNLLTGIIGYSELGLRRLEPGHPVRRNVEEIKRSGERAAALTRQLLAFSRKQILQPRVLDLHGVIREMDGLLQRLIGERIQLITELEPTAGHVMADPGQVEQVLMNLTVNARDAMPEGGKLVIKTADVDVASRCGEEHKETQPGRYVMLAVSDTGHGMNADTRAHIFEPFFTTKEQGKGTGLGLSTVYGIVKQSGGHICVISEPGAGATFEIYLPRVEPVVERIEPAAGARAAAPSGRETVLLVEDERMVRNMTREVLQRSGYRVIEATNGNEAANICRLHAGPIHLMLTDVVMPGVGGRELADSLYRLRPDMRVLYMSGYTDDAIMHHGVLNEGIAFIEKPFTPDALALKVRQVLETQPDELSLPSSRQ